MRKAAADGAQIILLPELFERQYFCQERQYEYYEFAKPVEENDAVKHFAKGRGGAQCRSSDQLL